MFRTVHSGDIVTIRKNHPYGKCIYGDCNNSHNMIQSHAGKILTVHDIGIVHNNNMIFNTIEGSAIFSVCMIEGGMLTDETMGEVVLTLHTKV